MNESIHRSTKNKEQSIPFYWHIILIIKPWQNLPLQHSLTLVMRLKGIINGGILWMGEDGFFYGIPFHRVVKFNPIDKSLTEIGPDFGQRGGKWKCGVRANNSNIYCVPYNSNRILKINTNDGTVETLDDVELPETCLCLWESWALASDNNIYYMPCFARLSSVGGYNKQ